MTAFSITRRLAVGGGVVAGGLSLYVAARLGGTAFASAASCGTAPSAELPPFSGPPLIASDANTLIHVVSDSLGDQVTETIYKMAVDLAADHPAHGVDYRLWRVDTGQYAAPVVIQSAGRHCIKIYNFAVGGSQPQRLFGRDRAAGLDPIDADIVIWQHGKNVASEQSPDGRMQSAYEMYRLKNQRAVHVAILEPPNRDDNRMEGMNQAIRRLAANYGDMIVIDSYSPWIVAGKPASCYIDNLHPNAVGVDLYSRPAIRAQMASARRPAWVTPARLSQHGPNLLRNGAFADFDGALPSGWTSPDDSAIAIMDRSRANVGREFSLKLSQRVRGGTIRQIFDSDQAAAIAGDHVWFAALMWIDTGATQLAGLIQLTVTDEIGVLHLGVQHTRDLRPAAEVSGRWAWCIGLTQRRIGGQVQPQGTSLKIFVDPVNAGAHVWVDRIILGRGLIPHDMIV